MAASFRLNRASSADARHCLSLKFRWSPILNATRCVEALQCAIVGCDLPGATPERQWHRAECLELPPNGEGSITCMITVPNTETTKPSSCAPPRRGHPTLCPERHLWISPRHTTRWPRWEPSMRGHSSLSVRPFLRLGPPALLIRAALGGSRDRRVDQRHDRELNAVGEPAAQVVKLRQCQTPCERIQGQTARETDPCIPRTARPPTASISPVPRSRPNR